jgi:hypothetical protein
MNEEKRIGPRDRRMIVARLLQEAERIWKARFALERAGQALRFRRPKRRRLRPAVVPNAG